MISEDTRERLDRILDEAGVISEAHFMLTSGRHTTLNIQCKKLFENPVLTEEICRILVDMMPDKNIDVVVGPATGGIIPAYEMSRILGVRNIFCERENGSMKLRRGFHIEPGERVLIAEDVITTGGSVKLTAAMIGALGGVAAGVCAVADLSGGRANLPIPSYIAAHIEIPSYSPEECPLCRRNLPLEHKASRSI